MTRGAYNLHSDTLVISEKKGHLGIFPLTLMYNRYVFIDHTPVLELLTLVMRAVKCTNTAPAIKVGDIHLLTYANAIPTSN